MSCTEVPADRAIAAPGTDASAAGEAGSGGDD
jgi:hypothetical protein